MKSVIITVRSIWKGEQEWIALLNNLPEEKLKQNFQQMYAKENKQAEVNSMKFEKTGKENEESFTFDVTINDFSKQMGNLYSFIPLEGATIIEDGGIISLNQRKTDIELKAQIKTEANINISIPEGTMIEFVPESVSLNNDKFGQYRYTVTKADKTISIHRIFLLTTKRITVKDYAEFKDFYKSCMDKDEQSVLLKKK
jgi:hypothetical protein